MAKKLNLNILDTPKTTKTPVQSHPASGQDIDVPATGRTITTGVGLKESELALIDSIVDKSDREIARNAVLRYAIRYFLKAYLAGQVDPLKDVESPKPKKKLRMP